MDSGLEAEPPRVGYVKLWALRCGVSLEWVLAWPAERGELIPIARQAVNITSLSPVYAPGWELLAA